VTNYVWLTAGPFHLVERPQLFGICFQPCLDSGPFKTAMAVHVLLESGLQRSEQSIQLSGRQLLSHFNATLLSLVCRHCLHPSLTMAPSAARFTRETAFHGLIGGQPLPDRPIRTPQHVARSHTRERKTPGAQLSASAATFAAFVILRRASATAVLSLPPSFSSRFSVLCVARIIAVNRPWSYRHSGLDSCRNAAFRNRPTVAVTSCGADSIKK
jgi:hypothetical protein